MDHIPIVMVNQLLKHAMKEAKVPAAVRERVTKAARDVRWVVGIVECVRTVDGRVEVFLSGWVKDQTGLIELSAPAFKFPPNAAGYEVEFKRAQNEDRKMMVVYNMVNGEAIILDLYVYAGSSDPQSNKRKGYTE